MIDWRKEVETIAPVTAEERLVDAIRSGDVHRLYAANRELAALMSLAIQQRYAENLVRPLVAAELARQMRPRLAWWRRLALRILGGEA